MLRLNTVVMVPKGAEFKAVQKGLFAAASETPETHSLKLISLPVGPEPVKAFLSQWCQESKAVLPNINVLLMGLCGSLTPRLGISDAVIYRRCFDGRSEKTESMLDFSNDVFTGSTKISTPSVIPVTGVMCDRVISRAIEKQTLGQRFQADVVDMEGFVALEILQQHVQSVSMLRVVSDDVAHDLPDLNEAFDFEGNIKPWVMTRQFLMQPVGALRLIQGSLSALNQLQKLAYTLAQGNPLEIKESHQSSDATL